MAPQVTDNNQVVASPEVMKTSEKFGNVEKPAKQIPSSVFGSFKLIGLLALAVFIASSYLLLFSPEHRWRHDPTQVLRSQITPVQAGAFVSAGLSLVLILGFVGVGFVGSTLQEEGRKVSRTQAPFTFGEWICFLSSVSGVAYVVYNLVEKLYAFHKAGYPFPHPLGLMTGIFSVAVGQVLIIVYHYIRSEMMYKNPAATTTSGKDNTIQIKSLVYNANGFWGDVKAHFLREEAFFLLLPYLSLTWMFNLMPESYYGWDGPVQWHLVFFKLLVVDYFTFVNHVTEHRIPEVYKRGHKPHHKFTNPQLFNAFDGSLTDTIVLILFPLYTSANLIHINNWTYVAFGTVYASYFMLIHSEFPHITDPLFRKLGIYVAEDHHVHHALFVYNYSHFFTYFDRLFGTYRSGASIKTFRSFSKNQAAVDEASAKAN